MPTEELLTSEAKDKIAVIAAQAQTGGVDPQTGKRLSRKKATARARAAVVSLGLPPQAQAQAAYHLRMIFRGARRGQA